jgi:hypothetical protein
MLSSEFLEWRQQRVGLRAVGIAAVPARALDTAANDVAAVASAVQRDCYLSPCARCVAILIPLSDAILCGCPLRVTVSQLP